MLIKIKNILLLIVFTTFNCSDNSSQYQNTSIEIEPIFTGVTSIYFKFKIAHPASDSELRLYRNDSLISQIKISLLDTIVADINLKPNKTYTYNATLNVNGGEYIKSKTIDLLTLDTTSQDFNIEIEHIGEFSSYLKDVEIYSFSNIWTVGAIWDVSLYGGVIWNGNSWEKKQFIYENISIKPSDIFSIEDSRKWLTKGSIYYYENDSTHQSYVRDIINHQIMNRTWGSAENKLFSVGTNGSILNYNGFEWRNVSVDSEDDFIDISGYSNDNGLNIWVIGGESIIYYDGDIWNNIISGIESIIKSPIIPTAVCALEEFNGVLISAFATAKSKNMVFFLSAEDSYPITVFEPDIYIRTIAASNLNDILVAGDNLRISHFNGFNHKNFFLKEPPGFLIGSDYYNGLFVIVGDIANSDAIIVKINR